MGLAGLKAAAWNVPGRLGRVPLLRAPTEQKDAVSFVEDYDPGSLSDRRLLSH